MSRARMDPLAAPRRPLRHEAALLLAVVAVAVATRVLWYAGDIPRFWFAETTSLWIAKALEQGDLWPQWRSMLSLTHVATVEGSAIMMPVALAFQALLGPSLHLPTLVGAFWGVLAVVLAWALGRGVHSPAFGLVFAGLVAASPLEITWSRLGGVLIVPAAYVLLVCWLGHSAGAHRSIALAILAGAAAWASVYFHYSARVALPLVFVALLSGFRISRPGRERALLLFAVCVSTVAAACAATRPSSLWGAIWPNFTGYVGNRGTQSPAEIARDIVTSLWREFPRAMRIYFWSDRTSDEYLGAATASGTALSASIGSGGLCLIPVAVLGLVGLLIAVWRWRRDGVWLALAVLGLMVPCLSALTARRFLLFDLAWCAFAAVGLVALLGARPSPRRLAAGVALVLGLAAYSFAIVMVLGGRLGPHHGAAIPFGESGFGDGRICLACARHARRWQDAIGAGSFVVLFDSDVDREDRTIPSGLPMYGKVGALAAGKPRSFLEYYSVVANFDFDPPYGGPIYDARVDFAAYLSGEIERERPTEIRWAFPQPTQWERWLADRLEAAGGERRALDDRSLAPTKIDDPGIEVTTPWTRRGDALAVVREAAGASPMENGCVAVEVLGTERYTVPAVVLAARPERAPERRWAIGSYHVIRDGDRELPIGEAIGLVVDGQDGPGRLDILTRWGHQVRYDPATAATEYVSHMPVHGPLGTDCAARLPDGWWVVDPVGGRVARTVAGKWTPPPGRWIGIAADPLGHLVLAAADQSIHVFDVDRERELRSFPARVPPSRRIHFAECSPVVAGDGWIATLDHLRGVVSVYDGDGGPLGAVPLGIRPMLTNQPTSMGIDHGLLGVSTGYEGDVVTLRLVIAPGCRGRRGTP